eukprot:CAMPEP_0194348186 /NCGR_PEP_ID=MMETSP0171-20130528/106396_1 /TAXON_ID=218684 /ORGANISM="Corethron pennatum, Strain L29A3" /LENGTH=393 /DNA_ID=CAMNT_0039115507 /DNA_START=594 /DNA_END=1775 /DNA_ORIENTATION=+
MTPHALAPALLLLAASAGAWSPSPPLRPFGRSSLSSMRASPRTIDFCKYEGLGNDFILVDDRGKSEPSLTPAESARLCDRNFGVGGDSVIFALDPTPSSATADVRMRIYNSDGSEPEMCGNGIRCYAQFLKDLGEEKATFVVETLAGPIMPQMNADRTITVDMGEPILNGPDVPCTLPPNGPDNSIVAQFLKDLGEEKATFVVETLAGPIVPQMNADGTITVDMGEPILNGPDVPCTLPPNGPDNSIVEAPHADHNGKAWQISAVSMGNPHCIVFVDDLEKDVDFHVDGPALEADATFPKKVNVEFVQVADDRHLLMKVWERGAGPTLACGTGACALAVAAMRAGKISRTKEGERVRVGLPGGDLFIEWRESNGRVYMSGPGTRAFQGTALIK